MWTEGWLACREMPWPRRSLDTVYHRSPITHVAAFLKVESRPPRPTRPWMRRCGKPRCPLRASPSAGQRDSRVVVWVHRTKARRTNRGPPTRCSVRYLMCANSVRNREIATSWPRYFDRELPGRLSLVPNQVKAVVSGSNTERRRLTLGL